MAKKRYTIEELDFKDDSPEEQVRTRKIFEDLKNRAEKGENLLEREKEFLCLSIKLSYNPDDGEPENFKFCNDFIFHELYLTYFHNDLAGPFFKAKRGKIVKVEMDEQLKDMKKLQNISDNWLKEIQITNHKDQILQELSTETRQDLKTLEIKIPNWVRKIKANQDRYRLQKDKIILQSKFIYHLAKSVMENYNPEDFEINFSGSIIEFTSYSLIHITSRHYAEPIKGNKAKTYHYKNFLPKELHLDLKNILTKIDNEHLIDINKTDNIIFEYEGITYQLWVQKRYKQIKGKGNVQINRIQSFYPIYDTAQLTKIKNDLQRIKIEHNLYLWYKPN
ncbi:hypothetical protein EG344_19430 [Chryseobacterium sp. G0162]|uniref:hypothetical protein n=1 Tax=Chryseobacterium sp. G0162 TaxID=2487063 RepID=UPI000F5046CF|nr:hypothetical protein [Chryseobacterium sp. G0162]AZB10855.1 hypothetical protein EG344_19430 [Chryseobacterium sp. G0162]